jgi:hypothetical protein
MAGRPRDRKRLENRAGLAWKRYQRRAWQASGGCILPWLADGNAGRNLDATHWQSVRLGNRRFGTMPDFR